MNKNLNYKNGYTYLWNRIQLTIDLLRTEKVTNEQLINLLELAQINAEEKCVGSVARGSGSRASHNRMGRRHYIK